jgi:hypothetical protein
MANEGEKKVEGESGVPEVPRQAGQQAGFDEDTDEAIVLPRPVPEINNDDDDDAKKADSVFDDMEIEVDEQEVRAESENQPDGRKY